MSDLSNIKFKIVDEIKDEWLTTLFDDDSVIYVKPGVYAMSTRKLEALFYIAKLQRYYQWLSSTDYFLRGFHSGVLANLRATKCT